MSKRHDAKLQKKKNTEPEDVKRDHGQKKIYLKNAGISSKPTTGMRKIQHEHTKHTKI